MEPTTHFDSRFSDPEASATPWAEAEAALIAAELYWLTTVRADGRPHVTPLIGAYHEGAVHFVTGSGEQKARNLEHARKVAMTTGTNTWAKGLDLVVEGEAVRVTDAAELQRARRRDRGQVRRGLALRRRGRRLRRPGRGPRPRVPRRAGEGARVRQGAARARRATASAERRARVDASDIRCTMVDSAVVTSEPEGRSSMPLTASWSGVRRDVRAGVRRRRDGGDRGRGGRQPRGGVRLRAVAARDGLRDRPGVGLPHQPGGDARAARRAQDRASRRPSATGSPQVLGGDRRRARCCS